MLPRAEEFHLRRAAQAQSVESSRGNGAGNRLQGQPDRRPSDRRVDYVPYAYMLNSPSVRRAMLTLSAKQVRAVSAEAQHLSLDKADTSMITGFPAFDAIGGEIPADGSE
jgi:hypothetical protein